MRWQSWSTARFEGSPASLVFYQPHGIDSDSFPGRTTQCYPQLCIGLEMPNDFNSIHPHWIKRLFADSLPRFTRLWFCKTELFSCLKYSNLVIWTYMCPLKSYLFFGWQFVLHTCAFRQILNFIFTVFYPLWGPLRLNTVLSWKCVAINGRVVRNFQSRWRIG